MFEGLDIAAELEFCGSFNGEDWS